MQFEFASFCSFTYLQSSFLQVIHIISLCIQFILLLFFFSTEDVWFCIFSSCILKSMKSASSCPVCKIPVTRRGTFLESWHHLPLNITLNMHLHETLITEVRPAPHMDNLVTIYKNMEAASGISLFVTQNTKLTGHSAFHFNTTSQFMCTLLLWPAIVVALSK